MYKPYERSAVTSVAKMYRIHIGSGGTMNQIESWLLILLKQHIRMCLKRGLIITRANVKQRLHQKVIKKGATWAPFFNYYWFK